mgnify:CR=1 FL=1
MIIETGFALNGPWGLLALMAMAVAMLVNRAGASMVFFDVVGRFQAQRLIKDADTSMTVFNSIMLDTFANMQDSLNVVGTSIEGLVTSVLPFTEAMEDAEIELRKFLDASEDIDQIADGVRRVGVEFGFTGDQALSAAAKMAQLASVLGPGQTEVGTQLGIEFGLISGMDTEAAMQRLINLNQQLFFMTKGTEELSTAEEKGNKIRENTLAVMNQLNTIENRSASTMEQVTFVMNQFASQAHLTGESIAMMAAQSAVLIETGEEQGKAGRALRMIYARLGADTNGARKELEALNIAVEDSNGNLRPLSRILGDLSGQWNEITAAERQAIAQSVAGNRHYTRFIKLMDNYQRATQLAFEGQMAMFPALEEVNIRLDENITKLRSAEAQLSNYRAELGENLLPALTLATENQAKFTLFVSDLVESLGPAATGAAALGLNLKNMVVPVLGVVTNIAALTVAIQAQRAVSRAMAGDQLVNEEAFSRVGTSYQSATSHLSELNTVKREFIAINDKEAKGYTFLTAAQKERGERLLKARQIQMKNLTETIATEEKALTQQKRKVQNLNIEIMKLEERGEASTEAQTNLKKEQRIYEELKLAVAELNDELTKQTAKMEEQAGELAEDRVNRLNHERKVTEELNEANAKAAQGMFALGGAAIGLGGAMMTLTDNQRINRIGMTLMTAGAAALAAQQANLALTTVVAMTADKLAISTKGKKRGAILAEVTATITQNIQTKLAALSTQFHTIKTEQQTLATLRGTTAIRAHTTAMGLFLAANAAAIGGVILAIGALVAVYKTLSNAEKRRKKELEDMANAQNDFVQADAQLFIETIEDQTLAIDDIIAKYKLAGEEVARYADATTDAGKQLFEDARGDEEALKQAAQVRLAALLNEQDITAETIRDVREAQDIVDAFLNPTENERRARALHSQLRIFREQQFNEASAIVAEHADLIEYLGLIEQTLPEEILNAIAANAASLEAFLGDANEYVDGITNTMETAAAAVGEFNSAREELFYGMAASNITGDLVRQVVNRGVENLLVNTEVIQTNNFNGMTTEEVAEEILDHIDRGARMRGVNMTNQSQSI